MKCLGERNWRTGTQLEPDCPALFESGREDRVLERFERLEDGRFLRLVGPEGNGKALTPFCYYCRATRNVRKIAGAADWTGRTPEWCPWREREN